MKLRVAVWAGVGFLVAGFWAVYAFATTPLAFGDPIFVLVRLTCPIANLGFLPLSLYFVLLANAATYAFLGWVCEVARLQLRQAE